MCKGLSERAIKAICECGWFLSAEYNRTYVAKNSLLYGKLSSGPEIKTERIWEFSLGSMVHRSFVLAIAPTGNEILRDDFSVKQPADRLDYMDHRGKRHEAISRSDPSCWEIADRGVGVVGAQPANLADSQPQGRHYRRT